MASKKFGENWKARGQTLPNIGRRRTCRNAQPSGMELSKTVGIYLDTGKQVGDVDHLKVFASEEVTKRWFVAHDPDGVAFEYPISE
jgi:hypothetical protein